MKFKIHIPRIIVYIILYYVAASFYSFMQTQWLLFVLILMGVSVPLDILCLFILRHYTKVSIDCPVLDIHKGEQAYVNVTIDNPTPLISMECMIKLEIANSFLNDSGDILIGLPVYLRKKNVTMIPVKASTNGDISSTVNSYTLIDLMGFIEVPTKTHEEASFHVLPIIDNRDTNKLDDISVGVTEAEESNKRGNDFSDVSDVREYIPGDKLMSIHWKLSAKRDVLMVKDRLTMSDQQMVLIPDLFAPKEDVDRILDLTYNLVRSSLSSGIYVRLMWWSFVSEELDVMTVDSNDKLDEAFKELYANSISSGNQDVTLYVASLYPELKAFVKVGVNEEGDLDAIPIEMEG